MQTVLDEPEEGFAPNLYFDRNFNREAAKILPGEYYVTRRDMVLVTVLGSCVAACIRDCRNGIGGMNHFMLPDDNGAENGLLSSSARYGTFAMEILINQLLKLGAQRSCFEAKVFGGGNVLRGFSSNSVGQRNADFVLRYLETERIRVVAQDLVDVYPRKVYYFPKTGRALVKKLRRQNNMTILERERDYSAQLQRTGIKGEVELFA